MKVRLSKNSDDSFSIFNQYDEEIGSFRQDGSWGFVSLSNGFIFKGGRKAKTVRILSGMSRSEALSAFFNIDKPYCC